MMNIYKCPTSEACNIIPNPHMAMIHMEEYNSWSCPVFKKGWDDRLLTVNVCDMDFDVIQDSWIRNNRDLKWKLNTMSHYKFFDEQMAQAIIQFVNRMTPQVDTFIVCCPGGQYRSGAVANFLADIFKSVVIKNNCLDDGNYNPYIYKILQITYLLQRYS
jgi:predicted protein tyrosine phosphatase